MNQLKAAAPAGELFAAATGRPGSSRLRRAREWLVLGAGFAVLGLCCLLYSALACLLTLVLRGERAKRVGRRLATLGFRSYLRALTACGAARFDLSALDALRDAGPLVIVANHPGLLDAPMVVSRLGDVTCVLKASLLRSPFWGAGSRLAGYIPNDWFLGSVNLAVDELRRGHQLLLFPEGTRTAAAPLGEFRGGAALVAHRAGVPVQAIFIEQDSGFLGKQRRLLSRPDMPMRFRVRLGRRFDAPADPRAFTRGLRAYFLEELAG